MGSASERRSQAENLTVALRRLRLILAVEVRVDWTAQPPMAIPLPQRPTADQPPALRIFRHCWPKHSTRCTLTNTSIRKAAERLACSASQLIGLLRDEPRALQILNDQRGERGSGRCAREIPYKGPGIPDAEGAGERSKELMRSVP